MQSLHRHLTDDGLADGDGVRLDVAVMERIGRALGTYALQQGRTRGRALVARRATSRGELRDGAVRGLLMSGFDVVDCGTPDPAVLEPALSESSAAVFIDGDEDNASVRLWLGPRALSGDSLVELGAIFAGVDFAVGEGELTFRAPRELVAAEPNADRAAAEEPPASVTNAALDEPTRLDD